MSTPDNLRDQIAEAMRESVRAGRIGFDNIATAVEAVVQAAITEARREAWEFGARAGSSYGYNARAAEDAAIRPPVRGLNITMPIWPTNPYVAGEHDAHTCDERLGRNGCTHEIHGPGEHDTPAGEPPLAADERHEYEPAAAGMTLARGLCLHVERVGLGPCGRTRDAAVHQPAQNLVTPMVVGADGRGAVPRTHEFTEDVNDASMCVCGIPGYPHHPVHTPPAQQPAGPDVDTAAFRADWPTPPEIHGRCDDLWDSARTLADALDARDAENARLHSWAGVMELLDYHWPASVWADVDDVVELHNERLDPGHRIIALMRHLDRISTDLTEAEAEIRELRAKVREDDRITGYPDHYVLNGHVERCLRGEEAEQQRDDARARLDGIRALCDLIDRRGVLDQRTQLARKIRAILDRATSEEAGR